MTGRAPKGPADTSTDGSSGDQPNARRPTTGAWRLSDLEVAGPRDAERLLALREAAAAWLTGRGIRQWQPGEVSIDDVHRQVPAGEWHVHRENDQIAGALRLLWQDEAIWGPQRPVAAYVHGLVIDRRYAGAGLGSALLGWAAHQARSRERPLLRLDCVEDNPGLRSVYERQGFHVVGRRDFDARWYSVVLMEKDLQAR